MSVEVAKWQRAFSDLGWSVGSVAGSGSADRILPGLALDVAEPSLDPRALTEALADADLVVVDNLCSLPLNPPASAAVADATRGRPAILRHHDLVWQHHRWDLAGWKVPTDSAWRHVVINELSRVQMGERGYDATTIYNTFDIDVAGDRNLTRARLGVAENEVLLLHPTRAIERKNIPEALALADAVGGIYWLTGEAEQDYGPELEGFLANFDGRVIRGPAEEMADAYAACDAVVFPSHWEGFGNPPIEAAIHRRGVAVGAYPVASELVARFGFEWLPTDDPKPLAEWIAAPDPEVIERNHRIAVEHFSSTSLGSTLGRLLETWEW